MSAGSAGSARHQRLTQALSALLDPVVTDHGLDLEALEVATAGRRRRVQMFVDRDGGVSDVDLAAVSRAVSDALDQTDLLGDGPYVLEVSSPGVTRPLTLPRHWRRNRGRLVRVRRTDGSEVTGRVLDSDAVGATLDVSGPVRVAFDDISRAVVQVEMRVSE